jgi:hypothetical protein
MKMEDRSRYVGSVEVGCSEVPSQVKFLSIDLRRVEGSVRPSSAAFAARDVVVGVVVEPEPRA